MTIRVVLADDHPIFRDGLVRSLEESGLFAVVGTGSTADEAVALVAEKKPDLVLLDISMPGSGIEAARRIAASPNPPRIAMVTVSEQDQDVTAALRAGAIGYVLKGISAAELAEVLTGIAARRGARLARPRRPAPQRDRAPAAQPGEAADRRAQQARVRHPAPGRPGMSNREVADALGLQEKTVKHYMTSILEKLQVRNRVEAALIARDAWGER